MYIYIIVKFDVVFKFPDILNKAKANYKKKKKILPCVTKTKVMNVTFHIFPSSSRLHHFFLRHKDVP